MINGTVQPAIIKSTTLITDRLESWAEGVLDQQLTKMSGAVNATLKSVTRDFRVRLYGAWSGLLWAMVGGGVIAGLTLFMAGFYLGKHRRKGGSATRQASNGSYILAVLFPRSDRLRSCGAGAARPQVSPLAFHVQFTTFVAPVNKRDVMEVIKVWLLVRNTPTLW